LSEMISAVQRVSLRQLRVLRSWPKSTSDTPIEIVAWLALYVVIAALAFAISHSTGDLHNDVLEAYAWGKELQFGYDKHPPFWAWVAYVWFSVFPRTALSGYLLGSVNGAVGLGCTWLIARRYLPSSTATAAVLSLMTATTYICFAERFNANAILLSLWPATTLVSLRASETRRIVDGFWSGVLIGLCLLSKYSSVIFVAVLFVAVHFPKRNNATYGSRAAIACYVVVGAMMLPHLVWLTRHDFLPFRYAEVATSRSFAAAVREVMLFPLAWAGFLAIPTLIYVVAAGLNWRKFMAVLREPFAGDRGQVAILAFGPMLVTMAICLLRASTLRFLYAGPLLFMAPIWFAMAPVGVDVALLPRVRKACAMVLAACLVASPIIAFFGTAYQARFIARPKSEIVRAVTDEWHRRFGVPLKIIGGTEDYAIAGPFYSRDSPSYLSGFDLRMLQDFGQTLGKGPTDAALMHSPWVSRERIARDGLAIICSQETERVEKGCDQEATYWIGPNAQTLKLTVAKSLMGWRLPSYRFQVYFRPPSPNRPMSAEP
jgi:hypothetical protein